jgi:hypothetical protein
MQKQLFHPPFSFFTLFSLWTHLIKQSKNLQYSILLQFTTLRSGYWGILKTALRYYGNSKATNTEGPKIKKLGIMFKIQINNRRMI